MKTLNGKLSISRPQRSDGKKTICISLTDEKSHCEVLEITIAPEELAEALTGLADRSCVFDLNDSGNVGKTAEHKTELVFIPEHDYSLKAEVIRHAVRLLEVDGWKGYDNDAQNYHKHVGRAVQNGIDGSTYRVSFRRYV